MKPSQPSTIEVLDLVSQLDVLSISGPTHVRVEQVEMDARLVKTGGLFIALKGNTLDGHDFITQAVENGAAYIISEKAIKVPEEVGLIIVSDTWKAMRIIGPAFYKNPTSQLTLIGVTGTNGKTTSTHLIDRILCDLGHKTGLIGTVEHRIAGKKIESSNTTPESLLLQRLFRDMVDQGVTHAIMEVSSHGLALERVDGCEFSVAGFTNLTQDHLDFHPSFEAYKEAKGKLFQQLTPEGIAVLNADDPASDYFASHTPAKVVTYGITHESDIRALNVRYQPKGMTFTLVTPFGETEIATELMGRFNVYNLLQAIGILLYIGISFGDMIPCIRNLKGIAGRMEPVDGGQAFPVIVDYAHTPDALENVLKTVREFTVGKLICVVGCGGDRDKSKRPLMAKISETYSDISIFTSDNPRSENPNDILMDMISGTKEDSQVVTIEDREQAIRHAISMASAEDLVLIAGKGHETYQLIGREKLPFDDRKIAESAINGHL